MTTTLCFLLRRSRVLLPILGLVSSLVCAESPTLRIGSYVQERSTGISLVIKPWLEAVRAEAGDQLTVKEYWGGVLGKSPHKQFELVQQGVLDITWVISAYTSGQFPELGLFELPFLFRSAQEASIVGWQLYEQGLLTGFDDVHLIGFFTNEPNVLFMREPVTSLNDLAGLKVRSLGAIHARWLQVLGASSQTLSAVDMNQALGRDMIDGVIQGWTGMRTFKTFPLVNQGWAIPLGSTAFLLLANRDTWKSLDPDIQKIMMRHGGRQFSDMGGSAYGQVGDSIRKAMEQEGRIRIVDPGMEVRAGMETRSRPVHEWWIKKTPNGKAVYEAAGQMLQQLRQAELEPS